MIILSTNNISHKTSLNDTMTDYLRESIRKAHILETQLKILIAETRIKEAINFTCLICMEPMDVYLKPPCKHYVCAPCFDKSVHSINGNKCCICRKALCLPNQVKT